MLCHRNVGTKQLTIHPVFFFFPFFSSPLSPTSLAFLLPVLLPESVCLKRVSGQCRQLVEQVGCLHNTISLLNVVDVVTCFREPEPAFEPERSLKPDCTTALFKIAFLRIPHTARCDENVGSPRNSIRQISAHRFTLSDLACAWFLGSKLEDEIDTNSQISFWRPINLVFYLFVVFLAF